MLVCDVSAVVIGWVGACDDQRVMCIMNQRGIISYDKNKNAKYKPGECC